MLGGVFISLFTSSDFFQCLFGSSGPYSLSCSWLLLCIRKCCDPSAVTQSDQLPSQMSLFLCLSTFACLKVLCPAAISKVYSFSALHLDLIPVLLKHVFCSNPPFAESLVSGFPNISAVLLYLNYISRCSFQFER